MSEPVLLLPLWLRLWHWLSAVLMLALVLSGLSLHFSVPGAWLIRFDLARQIHVVSGLGLAAAYLVFVLGNMVTGNGRHYLFAPAFWARTWAQIRYYGLDIFSGKEHPFPTTSENKFNALQQAIYLLVMYAVMPVLAASGLIFMFPELAPDHLFGYDALLTVAVVHTVSAFTMFIFALGHFYLATTGRTPTSMIRTMITGWSEK